MWQQQRDLQFSPQGIFKALQHSATPDEISPALFSCVLCGACDTLCPEKIEITATISSLRKEAFKQGIHPELKQQVETQLVTPSPNEKAEENTLLLAGKALRNNPATLNRIITLLSSEGTVSLASDDGDDIALALEAGIEISEHRLHAFLEPLQGAKRLYLNNAHLLKQLHHWLPATEHLATGHCLSQLSQLSNHIKHDDLYIVESRSYHLDHQRQVSHYDQLRHQRGCRINLDLQRNAIPTATGGLNALLPQIDSAQQGEWILNGHQVSRILVESIEDGQTMAQVSDLPVLHIADLIMEH